MGDLNEWFRAVDTDGNGQITAEELQLALRKGGLNFSLSTVARMIRVYDLDQNGAIDFREFQGLHEFLMTMQTTFNYFDQDRDSKLSVGEVHRAVRHAGFQLDAPAFQSMVRAFDPDADGYLGLAEFIALTLFLKSARAAFGAFDRNSTGSITLNFDQFIFAASHIA